MYNIGLIFSTQQEAWCSFSTTSARLCSGRESLTSSSLVAYHVSSAHSLITANSIVELMKPSPPSDAAGLGSDFGAEGPCHRVSKLRAQVQQQVVDSRPFLCPNHLTRSIIRCIHCLRDKVGQVTQNKAVTLARPPAFHPPFLALALSIHYCFFDNNFFSLLLIVTFS